MSSIIKEILKDSDELNIKLCKNHGLTLFDDFKFKPLEILGKGSFGEVYKAMWIKNREMMAVKKVRIQGINKEKLVENIVSFMVEIEVLKIIKKIKMMISNK